MDAKKTGELIRSMHHEKTRHNRKAEGLPLDPDEEEKQEQAEEDD